MYIGIDLGGTNIAAGLVSEDGKILHKGSVPTDSGRPSREIVQDMARLAKTLVSEYGADMSEVKSV